MIKIEINAENGADARKELIDLLGLGQTTVTLSPVTIEIKEPEGVIVGDGEKTAAEIIAEQPAAEEKKKRRTKAEIEAEKAALAANTGSEEPPASAETTSAPVEEKAAEPSHPDLPALQRVCAIMVRAGYKADAIKIIETVGKAASSADVLPENRQAVIDALTELAKQQNVTL